MAEMRKSTVQRMVQERTGRDIESHLRELYVARRLTDQEIASLLGISRVTVGEWRRQFGIDRTERKAALA
jgi:transcriptional regulator with XRE-family HTH domain